MSFIAIMEVYRHHLNGMLALLTSNNIAKKRKGHPKLHLQSMNSCGTYIRCVLI